jgi:hypothetical protein
MPWCLDPLGLRVKRLTKSTAGMFPQKYITWADTNRQNIASHQGGDGIFRPTVNPYGWTDTSEYTQGSPEGQAFTVYMYTAFRDCVAAGLCTPASTASTISVAGIGPFDYITVCAWFFGLAQVGKRCKADTRLARPS